MELKEILRKLVSFNTIKDKENKQIMDFIENYLKGLDFTTKRVDKCLIAYNDPNPNIGFIGHTDTVDYESWDGNPFELYEDGDVLKGLGACDMKGGIASILSAISNIQSTDKKIALYFTNDEEIGFEGINTIKDLIVPNNIIIGEPTNNVPIYGTKGVLELEVEFYGKKCHSSTPDIGINAIYECIDFIYLIIHKRYAVYWAFTHLNKITFCIYTIYFNIDIQRRNHQNGLCDLVGAMPAAC